MKRIYLFGFVILLLVVLAIGAFFLFKTNQQANNVVTGEIIKTEPGTPEIKTLTEKYTYDPREYVGVTVSNYDPNVLWIFGTVSSIKQDLSSPEGKLMVNIRGENLSINTNDQTKYSQAKRNIKTVEEAQFELIRSDQILDGDSVFITAHFYNNELLASLVQRTIK